MRARAFLYVLFLLVGSLSAQAEPAKGDPRLCEMAVTSPMTGNDWLVSMSSQCEEVSETGLALRKIDPKFKKALADWEGELAREDLNLGPIYRYVLYVVNDSGYKSEISLGKEFAFSAFADTLGSMVIKLEPCTRASIVFFSPGAPKFVNTDFVMAGEHIASRGWTARGGGEATLLLPMWKFAYTGQAIGHHISPEEAQSLACKQ